MKVTTTPLQGLLVIEPTIYTDMRGFFFESYQTMRYQEHHLPTFVQDNFSLSHKNVLRGLHYQLPNTQGKLVNVVHGKVWDVAVDLRLSSPTFKQWFSIILNDATNQQLYIPPGFAHGFCVLSDQAHFFYKCTDYYAKEADKGIKWNDPTLAIPWPIDNPIISPKDDVLPLFAEIPHEHFFK